MIERLLHIAVAFLPVLGFLGALAVLDSFKLIRWIDIVVSIGLGIAVAVFSLGVNTLILSSTAVDRMTFTRYIAPVVEELLKGTIIIIFIRTHRVGFIVDAVIRGFAIGTGFALVENLYYILARPDAQFFIWIIRGFGTALMHGGTTAILGVLVKTLFDKADSWKLRLAIVPLLAAILFHALYNHFILSPLLSTVLILILLPSVFILIFRRSEESTRDWLGVGFDTDRELLEMITTGTLAENKIGEYLSSLQNRFAPETVADMLCFVRLHLELAVKAKGLLLMQEAGFAIPHDPEIKTHIDELQYLQKSIGKTGLFALRPILDTKTRDLWQVHFLKSG